MKSLTESKIGAFLVVSMFLLTGWAGCVPGLDLDVSLSFDSDAAATEYSVTYHLTNSDEGFEDENVDSSYTVKTLDQTGLYTGSDKIKGWATSYGGAKAYNEGQEDVSITGNLDLYAVWQNGDIIYKKSDGGSGYITVYTQTRGASESLSVLAYDDSIFDGAFAPPESYAFFCWCDDPSGEGTTYLSGTSYSPKADLTLYPIYVLDTDSALFCGPNLKYRISDTGAMTFVGSGVMNEYAEGQFPWNVVDVSGTPTDMAPNITSVSLAYGMTSLPDFAFAGFSNESFTSIFIPDGVVDIGVGVFKGCSNLHTIEVGSSNSEYMAEDGILYARGTIYHDEDTDEDVIGKVSLLCYPPANRGINDLDTIIIPFYVTSIADYAFYGNAHLQYVIITEKVLTVGKYSFFQCGNLLSISFPDSVTSVDDYAFQGCSSLRAVQIGKGMTQMGSNVFLDCGSLEAVVMDFGRAQSLPCSGVFTQTNPDTEAVSDRTWFDFYPGMYDSQYSERSTKNEGWGYYSGDSHVADEDASAQSISAMKNGHVYLKSKQVYTKYTGTDGNSYVKIGIGEKFTAYNGSKSYSNVYPLSLGLGANVTCEDYGLVNRALYNGETTIIQGGSTDLGRLAAFVSGTTVFIPSSITGTKNGLEHSFIKILYIPTNLHNYSAAVDNVVSMLDTIQYLEVSPENAQLMKYGNCVMYRGTQYLYKAPISGQDVLIFNDEVRGTAGSALRGDSAVVSSKQVKSVIFSDNYTAIENCSFANNNYLQVLSLPSSVNYIPSGFSMGFFQNHCSLISNTTLNFNMNGSQTSASGRTLAIASTVSSQASISGYWYDMTGTNIVKTGAGSLSPGIYISSPDYAFKVIKDGNGAATDLYWNMTPTNYYNGSSWVDGEGYIVNIVCTGSSSTDLPDYTEAFLPPWSGYDVRFVNIQEGITSIGDNAFKGLSNLLSINIPIGVETIGDNAFYGTSLNGVYIPCTVVDIGEHAFENCPSLQAIYVSDSVVWTDSESKSCTGNQHYSSVDGVLLNKAKTEILKIPEGKTGSYSPPSTARTIHQYAFYKSSLSSVAFSWESEAVTVGITTIDTHAFDSSSIQTAELSKVSSLSQYAFADCKSLTTLVTGESLTVFPQHAFEGCDNLYNITIGATSPTFQNYSLPYKMKYSSSMGEIEDFDPATMKDESGYMLDDIGNFAIYTVNGDASTRVKVRMNDQPLETGINYMSVPLASSDKCGDNLYWSFIESSKLLLITGSGDTYTWQDVNGKRSPWYPIRASVDKVSLPSGIECIGDYAFHDTNITSISLPTTVDEIGVGAFKGTGLTAISLPTTVNSIGASSFEGTKIVSLEINVDVPEKAFYDITTLESVILGSGVTSVEALSFNIESGHSSVLATVVFSGTTTVVTTEDSESFPSVAGHWFENGTGTAKVTIPSSTAAVYYTYDDTGESSSYCGAWDTDHYGTNLSYAVANSILIVTGSGAMYDFTASDTTRLWHASTYTSVVLPTGLTHLGSYAFEGSSIASLDLSSVTSTSESNFTVGEGAAKGVTTLVSVKAPSYSNIGASAFEGCLGLTDLTVGTGSTFGNNAFKGCSKLSSLTLTGVSNMGDSVFENCSTMSTANIQGTGTSASDTTIGDNIFKGCSKLTSVKLKSVRSIGAGVFQNCSSLLLADLESVASMGADQFTGCAKLTTLKVTSMGVQQSAMNGITGPITLTISGVSIGDSAFMNHTSILALNSSGTSRTSTIGANAFKGCTSLTTVSLTDTTSIGEGAFDGCTSLETVSISSTKLASMDQGVFSNCVAGFTVNGGTMAHVDYMPAVNTAVVSYAITNHAVPTIQLIGDLSVEASITSVADGNTSKNIIMDLYGHDLTVPNAGLTVNHGIHLHIDDTSPQSNGKVKTSADTTGVAYYDWKHINTHDKVIYTVGTDTYHRALYDGYLLISLVELEPDNTGMFICWSNGTAGLMPDQCVLSLTDDGHSGSDGYYTMVLGGTTFGTATGFYLTAEFGDVSYQSTYTA